MVYLFLADGFEEVEALTVLDFLRRCPSLEVQSVSISGHLVKGSHGIRVTADLLIDQVIPDSIQMIILPGGMPGTRHLQQSKKLAQIIQYCARHQKYIGAICAAPSILAEHGLLDGQRVTCHPSVKQQMGNAVYTGSPVEIDQTIITARSAGTAPQFAFALIAVLIGQKQADMIKTEVLWEI